MTGAASGEEALLQREKQKPFFTEHKGPHPSTSGLAEGCAARLLGSSHSARQRLSSQPSTLRTGGSRGSSPRPGDTAVPALRHLTGGGSFRDLHLLRHEP